ncbi:MAG TPA: SDR family oxidoreductase [Blastocatellia bacterium]|nr:SDR family oxidoreductase [Blastocatellia bacterium]
MTGTILVTGSTGTVGSELVKHLAANGVRVRAAVQPTSKLERIKQAGAEPFVMNFNDAASIRAALEGIEKAFLITPVIPDQAAAAARFVAAAKDAGLKHLVKLSAIGADSGLDYQFVREHRQIEQEIEDSGLAYTFLRPNFFMQNFLGQVSIKTQGAFYDSSGDSKASHVDVRDIAALAVATLTESGHLGKAYTVTGPQALSNFEVADILSSVTGKPIAYVPVTDDQARSSLKAAGVPDWLVEALIELILAKRAGYMQLIASDVEQIIGRRLISFEQFARDHVEAFR